MRLRVNSIVLIRTYGKVWRDAVIIDTGKDTLRGTQEVFCVRHPHFADDLYFYQQATSEGKRFNVGNKAFWIEEQGA